MREECCIPIREYNVLKSKFNFQVVNVPTSSQHVSILHKAFNPFGKPFGSVLLF